jgi:hypothetical protein
MNRRGQVLILVAVLIPVALLLLAVAVDAGRLYIEQGQVKRAAQAAADAGISVVAEQIVTLAVARQTHLAGTWTPTRPATRTATPPLRQAFGWLSDEGRAALVSEPLRSTPEAAALGYALRNCLDPDDPSTLELRVTYPQAGYDPRDPSISTLDFLVTVRRRVSILLAGLLGRDFVELEVEAQSQVPQR